MGHLRVDPEDGGDDLENSPDKKKKKENTFKKQIEKFEKSENRRRPEEMFKVGIETIDAKLIDL